MAIQTLTFASGLEDTYIDNIPCQPVNLLSQVNSLNAYRIPSASSRKQLAIVIVNNQQSFSYKNMVFPMGSIALFVSHGMVYNRIGEGDGAPRFLDAIDSER